MEEILAVVAESFGYPVSCHPDQPASHLYTGPWDGQHMGIQFGGANGPHHLVGTFDPERRCCELVWAFNEGKYRAWLTETQFLRSPPPPPRRTANTKLLKELSDLARGLIENFSVWYPDVQQTPEAVVVSQDVV